MAQRWDGKDSVDISWMSIWFVASVVKIAQAWLLEWKEKTPKQVS